MLVRRKGANGDAMLREMAARSPSGGPSGLMLALKSSS